MRKIYFQRDYLTIFYDEEKSLGGASWKGFLNSTEFRESFLQCLNLIKEKQLTKWLADNRKLKAIRQADQLWAVEEGAPLLAKLPLRKMANLVSEDIFGQMAVESMFTRANDLIRFDSAYFKSEWDALRWLETDTPYLPSPSPARFGYSTDSAT